MTIATQHLDPRRRRIYFRAWHRGTREMDYILGTFCDQNLATLSTDELDILETLMDIDDQTLFRWVSGSLEPHRDYDHAILARLRDIKFIQSDFA